MLVISILVVLIVLVIAILILGGSTQRRENRRLEKENKEAIKKVKREIKNKKKEVRKEPDEYVDILRRPGNEIEEYEKEEEAENDNCEINNQEVVQSFEEVDRDYEEKLETVEEVTEEPKKLETEEDIIEETEKPEESDSDIQFLFDNPIEEKVEVKEIPVSEEKPIEQEDPEQDPEMEFFFVEKEDRIDEELERYMKEAQANDIGYLNGDDAEIEEPEENIFDIVKEQIKQVEEEEKPKKKETTKKTTKTTSQKTESKKATTKKATTKKATTKKTTTTKKKEDKE